MKIWHGLRYAFPIGLALWGMIGIVCIKAFGQEQAKVPVPLAASEMKVILDMCEAAKFGYRAQFDAICPNLKTRFDAAEKDAVKPAEPEKEK